MVLRVTNVPNPPIGSDWAFAIPGQYTYDIRAIVADYIAQDASGTATLVDGSGNGNDGSYIGFVDPGTSIPGLISGDRAVTWHAGGVDVYVTWALVPVPVCDFTGDFAFEGWFRFQPGQTFRSVCVNAYDAATDLFIGIDIDPGVPWITFVRNWPVQEVHRTAAGTFPVDGNVHQLVVNLSGGVTTIYVDAVAQPLIIDDPPLALAPNPDHADLAGVGDAIAFSAADADEHAFFTGGLSAGQVAAHYAAGLSGFAALSAAILADVPDTYYHLDDTGGFIPAQRYTALDVSDGTHVVAAYTSGELSLLTGNITYVWTPGTSSVGVVDNRAVIGVPPLVLPAGYVLSSDTPAIGAGDQWSNIAIWWDDALSGQPGYGAYDKYANVLLIP